jgi:Protein of unknown function (DUF2961)
MMNTFRTVSAVFFLCLFSSCMDNDKHAGKNDEMFSFSEGQEARWSSPENPNGAKGNGGTSNNSAKGHPYDTIAAGASLDLLNIKEQGIIRRIWITINDRSPGMLRALKLEMFWDGETQPAVSVPFGDFFSVGLGRMTVFQNALFADPEGRSFNCFIPMPFRKGARITVTNESGRRLNNIFFDVDYTLVKDWNEDNLYFHASWHRDTATQLAKDFELLPRVSGKGRFLGVNIGVNGNSRYKTSWFGEGEVKMYIDGDTEHPTLNGTGTEDYIGTAWGQGKFINQYTGCTVADDSLLQWSFYRFHIPDPVYFKNDCRVAIQQLGGDMRDAVATYQREGAPLIPVTTDDGKMHAYYKKDSLVKIDSLTIPNGWTNFYRSDDVSATAYFYLDKPVNGLPPLQPVGIRTAALRVKP